VVALGLREAGRLVAAVRLRVLGDGLLQLGRLAVAPDRQGGGLGTWLLVESETVVPDTRRIELFTGDLSAANLRLYHRHGYVETHRTPAGNHQLVHLTKILVPRDPSHPGWTPGWSIVAELVRCMRGGPGRGGRPW
jgi:GNAT superfamily N-acetyltransferase